MRGGLDDALSKLARRDELRRRAAGESTGRPAAVDDLVEAIAAVVGRNPKLEVTVGVEGVGDPTLLHFFTENGQVQVNADHTLPARPAEPAAATPPRHADFDLVAEEDVPPVFSAPPAHAAGSYHDPGQGTRRISHDDRDRYDPGTGYEATPYASSGRPEGYSRAPAADAVIDDPPYQGESVFDPEPAYEPEVGRSSAFPIHDARPSPATSRPTANQPAAGQPSPSRPAEGARTPNGQTAEPRREQQRGEQPRHPFAATPPPPVPPQRPQPAAQPQHPGLKPLDEPIPFEINAEETEQAARRLSALLRDNPSLLNRTD